MSKLKDIPKPERPREKFLQKGPDALTKSELLAILIGTGIKNKNVKQISEQIVRKYNNNLLNITVDELLKISGIGKAKALQIISSIELVKRLYREIIGYSAEGVQLPLFDTKVAKNADYEIIGEKIQEKHFCIPRIKQNNIQLQNRRYIGSKYKLIDWIFSIINKECDEKKSFADVFAGTGVISMVAAHHFNELIVNDHLYSNYIIYKAFFSSGKWNRDKIDNIIRDYNNIDGSDLEDNYFSEYFGGKYFSKNSSKIIGFIRENIEKNKNNFTDKEYYILIASLLYSVDKIANTVGHYDAYFKKDYIEDRFFIRSIDPLEVKNISIYREDTNQLAKKIKADVVYIDPPYNSRQYSRFYHVLETLTKWDKPKLYGTALKPIPENMSDYCRVHAKKRLADLVKDLNTKYLIVSYNNTYDSKSNSSKNKITLQGIEEILTSKGKTKIFEKDYRHFNAGNTNFNNHKEYLFVTRVNYE